MTDAGVKRWTKSGQQPDVKDGTVNVNQPNINPAPVLNPYKPLDHIDREDWLEYNKYLTVNNPFLKAQCYEELTSIWFTEAFELNKRAQIIKEDLERINADGEDSKSRQDADERLKLVEDKYRLLDNQCLAVLMYKICAVIDKIKQFDHGFNYDEWVFQGKNWQEFNDYLEKVQEPEDEQ